MKRKTDEKQKMKKGIRGITLIALVVTIVVLLILAGVSINLVVGNNGIVTKAGDASNKSKQADATDRIEMMLNEWQIEKYTGDGNFGTFLNGKKEANEIDDVTANGDGTYSIEKGDYIFTVKDDGTEITNVETLKGIVPQLSYAIYSDTAGQSQIETSKKYDKVYIGVKVTNAGDYTSAPTLELKAPNGSTVSSTTVSGYNGYYEINNNGQFVLTVTGTNNDGTRSKTQPIVISCMDVLPGSTILRSQAPKITVNGLKYADIDGDGIADGIIVADISQESTDTTNTYKGGNPWGDSWGSFSYTAQTTGLKSYSLDTNYKYTNPDGSQVDGTLITCTNNSGTPQYYILSLANYDSNIHYWYKNAYGKMSDYSTFTSQNFGKGKENTEKMIDRMKNHSDTSKYSVDYGEATTGTNADVWSIIQDKANEGWFVPSRAEWAAFASYLNPSKTSGDANYYGNYGLSSWYWSSAQSNTSRAYRVNFYTGNVGNYTVNDSYGVRLASTF